MEIQIENKGKGWSESDNGSWGLLRAKYGHCGCGL